MGRPKPILIREAAARSVGGPLGVVEGKVVLVHLERVGWDRKQPRWQSLPRALPLKHATMNVSLPEELRTFVDEQVEDGRYGSTSEYVRELIRRDQDRHRLRGLLLDGATSVSGPVADDTYFAALRTRVQPGT